MPFAWFVALRYLRSAWGQTALIVSAVAVGVAVVVFLSALMGGLQDSLIDKILGSQAHVRVTVPREAPRALVEATPRGPALVREIQPASQRLRSIDGWPALLAEIERTRGVIASSPMVLGAGFVVRVDGREPVLIRGVEPEAFLGIIDLRKKLIAGQFDVTGGHVGIGAGLAKLLQVGVGDKLRLATADGVEDLVTISGIFSLGADTIDKTWLVTSLRHGQALFGLPGGVTTLELKVGDVFQAEELAVRLRDKTDLLVESWMTTNVDLLQGLSAQESSKYLIQFFVMVTVALGIASVLAVSVVQKSREIGILRAVGTRSRRVQEVFLVQGGVLGLVGSLVGSVIGITLAKLFQGLLLEPDGQPKFIVNITPSLFLQAAALATVVGLLAAVVPARRVARIDPAAAIRDG